MRVAVLGYVNVDHVTALNRDLEPGITAQVDRWHTGPQGRLGGCASYIATGLAAAGVEVTIISATGPDRRGAAVAGQLRQAGVDISGLDQAGQPRTGTSWLAYSPSGTGYCVYDAGGPLPVALTAVQRDLCARADWLVTSVGPPSPCGQALSALSAGARVCWPVKADPVSFPPGLARALAARAKIIVYSAEEAGFLAGMAGPGWRDLVAGPDALIVETRSADGARFWEAGRAGELRPEEVVEAADSVGAGDRFCAGLLAARIIGATAEEAVSSGMAAAAGLLSERAGQEAAGCKEECG